MAASSETSVSNEISDSDLIAWFPDINQQSLVLLSWIAAKSALEAFEPASDEARATWANGCRVLRNIIGTSNIIGSHDIVCRIFDGLTEKLRRLQPETGAGKSAKRRKTTTAPSAPRQERVGASHMIPANTCPGANSSSLEQTDPATKTILIRLYLVFAVELIGVAGVQLK